MKITLDEYKALSIQGRQKTFLIWLRTKPKDTRYHYFDILNCPIAQFGREMVNEEVRADYNGFIIWRTRQHIRILNRRRQEHSLMLSKTFGEAAQSLAFQL